MTIRALLLDDQEFLWLSQHLQWLDAAPGLPQIVEVGKLRDAIQRALPPEASLSTASTEALLAEVSHRMQPYPPVRPDPPAELDDETRLLSMHRDCSEHVCLFADNPSVAAQCPYAAPAAAQAEEPAEPQQALEHPALTAQEYIAEVGDLRSEVEWAALEPEELGKRTATLRDLLASGLPTSVPITATPDVLALYGVDMEEVEAAVRLPQRVEVRPESMDKRYATLAFFRGDMQVILGFRFPRQPGVMAVYLGSMLTHDSHHVDHQGGGAGGRQANKLPTTPRQLINRLKATGATVAHDPASTSGAMLVTFRGHDIGKISGERMDRKQVQSDFNRMQRRMQAIARQEEGLSA